MATVEPWRLEQRSATTRARALTPAQARALLALARIGHPATSADVAAAIGDGCTTMGAAQALRGLEAAGLVRGVLGADVTRGIRDGQGWSVLVRFGYDVFIHERGIVEQIAQMYPR